MMYVTQVIQLIAASCGFLINDLSIYLSKLALPTKINIVSPDLESHYFIHA